MNTKLQENPVSVALNEMIDIAGDEGMHPDRINGVGDAFSCMENVLISVHSIASADLEGGAFDLGQRLIDIEELAASALKKARGES